MKAMDASYWLFEVVLSFVFRVSFEVILWSSGFSRLSEYNRLERVKNNRIGIQNAANQFQFATRAVHGGMDVQLYWP